MLPRGFVFLCLISICCSARAAIEPLPFWRTKEKVYRRIEDGDVIVVVKAGPNESALLNSSAAKNHLRIEGGGQVRAPADFVFRQAMDFDSLSKVSGYIKSQKYDPESKTLDLEIAAYGYQGKMKVRIKDHGLESVPRIEFEIISGSMKGLAGTFKFRPLGARKSEVGIEGDFRYDQFPVPRVFLEFGLEVVFQRMAGRLRQHVESEFKKIPSGGA